MKIYIHKHGYENLFVIKICEKVLHFLYFISNLPLYVTRIYYVHSTHFKTMHKRIKIRYLLTFNSLDNYTTAANCKYQYLMQRNWQ